jgi:hypothetical protein
MTDQPLSPAAAAVLRAAGDSEPGIHATIAAALRAAANQLFETEIFPPGYAYSAPAEMWHYEFCLKAHRNLCAIAAELEGRQ